MAQIARESYSPKETPAGVRLVEGQAAPNGAGYQAYQILHFAFTVAPLVAGIDKFFHVLTNWDQYLAPVIPGTLAINGHSLMLIAGVAEIVVAIGVALKPRIFAYVASAWLLGIVVNLLLTGHYFDIALRDFGLALGALALGRLSMVFD